LVNRNGVSIHHVVNGVRFCPVPFIFDERFARMVNRWCAAANPAASQDLRRELHVKSILFKTLRVKLRK
jgi:hypothetical protein